MDLNMVFNILDYPIYVSTLIGESVVVTHVYHALLVLFVGFQDMGRPNYSGCVRL